jgi:hypothetical protein
MRLIVTDKLARRQRNFRAMVEIEMPCCGTATRVEELTGEVGCETCNVVLELADTATEALPVAA